MHVLTYGLTPLYMSISVGTDVHAVTHFYKYFKLHTQTFNYIQNVHTDT